VTDHYEENILKVILAILTYVSNIENNLCEDIHLQPNARILFIIQFKSVINRHLQ
jgi:hypothetical protein